MQIYAILGILDLVTFVYMTNVVVVGGGCCWSLINKLISDQHVAVMPPGVSQTHWIWICANIRVWLKFNRKYSAKPALSQRYASAKQQRQWPESPFCLVYIFFFIHRALILAPDVNYASAMQQISDFRTNFPICLLLTGQRQLSPSLALIDLVQRLRQSFMML